MAIYTGTNWGDAPEGAIVQVVKYTITSGTPTYVVYRSGTLLISQSFTQKFANSWIRLDFQSNHSMSGPWDGSHWGFYQNSNLIRRFGNSNPSVGNLPCTMNATYTYNGVGDTNAHTYQLYMFDCNNDGVTFRMNQPGSGTSAVGNIADYCNNTYYQMTITEIAR